MGGLLEVVGVRRSFGALTALDGLSFSVASGRVVGFLGPNGAGKTTTMRAIFGLTDLQAGCVRWDGVDVGQAERRRFGYMPDRRRLRSPCPSWSASTRWPGGSSSPPP
jgi:ABC-2 type transport system ATP-binding protein